MMQETHAQYCTTVLCLSGIAGAFQQSSGYSTVLCRCDDKPGGCGDVVANVSFTIVVIYRSIFCERTRTFCNVRELRPAHSEFGPIYDILGKGEKKRYSRVE